MVHADDLGALGCSLLACEMVAEKVGYLGFCNIYPYLFRLFHIIEKKYKKKLG